MDPDQIFKRFFGTSFPEIGRQPFRPVDSEDGSGSWSGGSGPGTDHFDDLHLRIHQQMEEMDRQMQEVFRLFTTHPHIPPGVPALPEGSEDRQPHSQPNARSQMLKKEKEEPAQPSQSPGERPRPFFRGSVFGPWFEQFTVTPRLDSIPHQERRDDDLDSKKPSKEEVVDLYRHSRDPSPPQFFGSGQSVSIQTVVGADGVREERRTVRDSSGREETTITRTMGDREHTVTTISDGTGQEEKRETFHNIDQDQMSEFERQWQGRGRRSDPPLLTDPDTAVKTPSPPGGALSDNRGLFRKFFDF